MADADRDALVEAIAARLKEHPAVCKLGLDEETVATLKEIADGYREGKSKAVRWMLKLVGYGLILGALTAIANIDIRALIRGIFGLPP
jgi:hypothetical protein